MALQRSHVFPSDVTSLCQIIGSDFIIVINNEGVGIVVTRSSSARITGNTISNNMGGGVVVNDSATAEINPEEGVSGGSNTITGNGGGGSNARDGIFVGRSSSAKVESNTISSLVGTSQACPISPQG